MEQGWDFMARIMEYPVAECGESLRSLTEAVRAAGAEVLFSERKHVQDLDRLFYLREGLIPGFIAAARALNQRGWIMRVEDGYRTRTMQKFLGRCQAVFDQILRRLIWECGGQIPAADFMFRRCSALAASTPKCGTHMAASAIDISVFARDDPTREIDRGAPYIELSELTPMESPFVSEQARCNRREITALMSRHGFVAYPFEFWHYSGGDAYDACLNQTGKPARYGPVDWDSTTNTVQPILNPQTQLNTGEEIHQELEQALQRLKAVRKA